MLLNIYRGVKVMAKRRKVNRASDKQGGTEGCLHVTAAIKILAGELLSGGHEATLCRAAVRLAEEGGIIDSCRARWDAEQENAAGQSSNYLFDRRQCRS